MNKLKIVKFFKSFILGKKVLILISPIITFLMGVNILIWVLIGFITLDLITGIIKYLVKNNIFKKMLKVNKATFFKVIWYNIKLILSAIKSELIRETLKKSYEYISLIIVVFILEHFIVGITMVTLMTKAFSLTEMAFVVPSMIEAWSIGENVAATTGNESVFKKLFKVVLPKRWYELLSNEKQDETIDEEF